MPVLNDACEALMNGANGPLSDAAGTVLQPLVGLTQHLNDRTAIFQGYVTTGGVTKACLQTMDVATRIVQTIPNTPGTNQLVAAGNVWAAFYGGQYYDSYGKGGVGWYPLAVDGGRILVSPHYGNSLAWWDGTTLTTLSTANLDGPLVASADRGIAIANIGGVLRTFPEQHWPAFHGVINFTARDGWLTGWHQGLNALVLWQTGPSPLAFVLSHGYNYGADVALDLYGTVVVVASSGQGQLPGELLTYRVDPVAHTCNGQPCQLVDLTAPPVSVPDPVQIPTFTATTKAIGIAVVDDPHGPIWCGVDETPGSWTRAVWIDISRDSRIVAARAKAVACGYPARAYVDRGTYDLPVPTGCIPMVQAYLAVGEPIDVFSDRLFDEVRRLNQAGHTVDLCVRAFTGARGAGLTDYFTEQQVLDAMRVCWAVARACRVGVLWFFADQRADGLPAHLVFVTAIDRQRAASSGPNVFPVLTPPVPPVETDPDMPPVLYPDNSPELAAFRAAEGAAYDATYGPLLGATNGVGECSEVNSVLRTKYTMDGDRAILQPLMLENAMRKRTQTTDKMAASIEAAVIAWRRLRGY